MQATALLRMLEQGPFNCVHAEFEPAHWPHEPDDVYTCEFDVNGQQVALQQRLPERRLEPRRPSIRELAEMIEYRLMQHVQGERRKVQEATSLAR